MTTIHTNITPLARPAAEGSKFTTGRGPRALLARDADSVYWMSRYVERAEHVARTLLVTSNLLIDVGDLAPALQRRQWQSILTIMRAGELPAGEGSIANRAEQYMTFDAENPNSLLSCISKARENARGIRETISAEMWENLNTVYLALRAEDAAARFEESHDEFYRQTMTSSMLFQGLTDQTLSRDQRWQFTQLAKYLERIDVTARVLETKFEILQPSEARLETPIKNIHWMAVLRCCCSIEAFRRHHIGDLDPLLVAQFLILEADFPRTIRFCVGQAHEAIAQIRADVSPRGIDAAERILGRLKTQLDYAEMNEILIQGLPQYLQKIQSDIAEAALAVQNAYFMH